MSENKSGLGKVGFGAIGGEGVEFKLFGNRVIQGCLAAASTTGSSQLTGAGNGTYLYDMTTGLIAVGNKVLEIAAVADGALEAAGNIMADGYSKVYTLIAYKSTDGVARTRLFVGTAELTGAQVPVTDAVISESFATGVPWYRLWDYTIARTGDTTVTEAYSNTVRPTLIPEADNK